MPEASLEEWRSALARARARGDARTLESLRAGLRRDGLLEHFQASEFVVAPVFTLPARAAAPTRRKEKTSTMAKKSEDLEPIKKSLQAIVDDDDAEEDDKDKARAALKALEDGDEEEKAAGLAKAQSALGSYLRKARARSSRAAMTPEQRRAFDHARAESESRARLSPAQVALLERTAPKRVESESRATLVGTTLVMPVHMTREQAAARIAELEKEIG